MKYFIESLGGCLCHAWAAALDMSDPVNTAGYLVLHNILHRVPGLVELQSIER
jgi:hypothetical protein